MQAILPGTSGGPETMALGQVPDPPPPGAGELLIAVRAVGVNRADCLQRAGNYPPPPGASEILGLELAGEVRAVGSGVSDFAVGDRVMSLVTGGAYAEQALAHAAFSMPVPASCSWAEAGAIPEAFLTAWLNLFTLGELRAGETVLVHAGASGVGMAAIQLAREAGARVFTTAGSAEKLAFARGLGAELGVNRHDADFAEVAREASDGGKGVDLILDFVGAPYWEQNLRALRRGGRLCLIGFLGGAAGQLSLAPILGKTLTVRGTTLRRTPADEKGALVREFAAFALPRFADGRLKVPIDRTFPLAEAGAAHAAMERNETVGKLVLLVD